MLIHIYKGDIMKKISLFLTFFMFVFLLCGCKSNNLQGVYQHKDYNSESYMEPYNEYFSFYGGEYILYGLDTRVNSDAKPILIKETDTEEKYSSPLIPGETISYINYISEKYDIMVYDHGILTKVDDNYFYTDKKELIYWNENKIIYISKIGNSYFEKVK